jgi:hypothetical protein
MVGMGFWKFFRASQRWKKELLRVNRILGQPISSVEMLLTRAADSAQEELFDLILGDRTLFSLLQKHGAGREELQELYRELMNAGTGQWVRGHWVAASALCYGFTLDFVLTRSREGKAAHRNPREIWLPIAFELVQYFAKGKVGRLRAS